MKDDAIERTIDCSNPRQKRELMTLIAPLQGLWTFTAERASARMSDRARGYYFGVVCKSLIQYVKAQGDCMTKDSAHAFFKSRCLEPKTFTNTSTGEIETYQASISKFNTEEGAAYIDKCIVFLAQMGVIVPEPTYRSSAA